MSRPACPLVHLASWRANKSRRYLVGLDIEAAQPIIKIYVLIFPLWQLPEMREKDICFVQNIFIPPTMWFWLLASELNMKCKMKSVVVMIGGWGALSPIPAISIYFHSPQLTEILDYYRYVPKMRVKFTSVQRDKFSVSHIITRWHD